MRFRIQDIFYSGSGVGVPSYYIFLLFRVKDAAPGLEEEHLSPWMSDMHPTECYGQNIHNYTNVICCHAAGGLLVLLQGYTVLTWIFFYR